LLQNWLNSPDGQASRQAFAWALGAEAISFLADVMAKLIQGLQQHPEKFPLGKAALVDILSVQWDLIFLGFGALVGSFLATPRTRRNPMVLFGPFMWTTAALFVIAIIYGLWPWVGPLWARVLLTDTIGLSVIYYCVHRAAKVRKP
jgi:hypothetical protein